MSAMSIEHTLADALSCLHDVEIALGSLIAERDALAQEVDRLKADGVHSCGPHCQRIACVLRRERDALQAATAALVEQVERGAFDIIGPDHPNSAVHQARAALASAQGVQS